MVLVCFFFLHNRKTPRMMQLQSSQFWFSEMTWSINQNYSPQAVLRTGRGQGNSSGCSLFSGCSVGSLLRSELPGRGRRARPWLLSLWVPSHYCGPGPSTGTGAAEPRHSRHWSAGAWLNGNKYWEHSLSLTARGERASRDVCAGRMEGPSWKISYLKTEANNTKPFLHLIEILHNLDVSKRKQVKYSTKKSEYRSWHSCSSLGTKFLKGLSSLAQIQRTVVW